MFMPSALLSGIENRPQQRISQARGQQGKQLINGYLFRSSLFAYIVRQADIDLI